MPFEVSPKESNFNVIQGDSFSLNVAYKDPSGSAINLAGYTATFEVRDKPGGKIICATSSVGDGITITSASGLIDVFLSSAKTSNFTVPRAAYQFQISSASTKTTLLYGWLMVEKSVIDE
jgi:hypothetical protein